MEKAFKVVVNLKDEKLGPLLKKLNTSKLNAEKEDLKLQIASAKDEMQKARKEALEKLSGPTSKKFGSTSSAKLGLNGTKLSKRCMGRIPGLQ